MRYRTRASPHGSRENENLVSGRAKRTRRYREAQRTELQQRNQLSGFQHVPRAPRSPRRTAPTARPFPIVRGTHQYAPPREVFAGACIPAAISINSRPRDSIGSPCRPSSWTARRAASSPRSPLPRRTRARSSAAYDGRLCSRALPGRRADPSARAGRRPGSRRRCS